jgi:flagellar basal body P-ring formation protein FlgA
MSGNSRVNTPLFAPPQRSPRHRVAAVEKHPDPWFFGLCLLALWLLGLAAPALAQSADGVLDATLEQQVRALAEDASRSVSAATPGARVEIEVGRLNPRLRLAPCAQVRPYLPSGTRLWGASRIGLRCMQGSVPWNVYLPINVKVFAQSLVLSGALASGTVLREDHLTRAEVDLAAGPPLLSEAQQVLGRSLARPMAAGAPLRSADLKLRQWFAAGDTVHIAATGAGYAVNGEGVALAAGLEGKTVRVRTESGRIVTGVAVAERQVELD